MVYDGAGGNDLLHDKRQIADQTLDRGNLALTGNHEHAIPVRVTRKNKCKESYTGRRASTSPPPPPLLFRPASRSTGYCAASTVAGLGPGPARPNPMNYSRYVRGRLTAQAQCIYYSTEKEENGIRYMIIRVLFQLYSR